MTIKSYATAIKEAQDQLLDLHDEVFVLGQSINHSWAIGGTTAGLLSKYGEKRFIDTPVSELGVTGVAIGAALAGMRPIVVHPRMAFMYLATDQIINNGAYWYYMFGGQVNVPVTIRAILSRGFEQGAQHSQSPYSIYAHFPGLKVVCPASPYDAKGLLISAVRDENPVLYIDDCWLYDLEEEVPDEAYEVPIGKGKICRKGADITVVAISYFVREALEAAKELEQRGISVEVIDPRTIKPLDTNIIIESVKKTGRLVVADPDFPYCSFGEHISYVVSSEAFEFLKAPVKCINLPDVPIPASEILEKAYYPKKDAIVKGIQGFF